MKLFVDLILIAIGLAQVITAAITIRDVYRNRRGVRRFTDKRVKGFLK